MSDNPYENIFPDTPDNQSDSFEKTEFISEIDNSPFTDLVSEYNIKYNDSAVQRPEPVLEEFSPYAENPANTLEQQPVQNAPAAESVSPQQAVYREWNSYGNSPSAATPVAPYTQPQPVYAVPKARKKEKKRMPTAVILLLCVVLSVVFGTASAFVVNKYFDKKTQIINSEGLTINQIDPDYYENDGYADGGLATADIVEMTADSVVEIITESVQTGSFAQQYIQSGAGSGVIIDREGYIVTNHHVIEGARKITITLRSGDSYDATLIGSDSKMDLALLKIEAQNLTAAVFGDSDKLKVGQRTVAIGNPLGQLGGTVTEGILSALDRELVVDGKTMNLLQTDTAINPGNSGGGLFDAQGALIGIVVAKSSGSEVEGLGFAVPANDVVDVIADLMEYGYVRGRVSVGMEFLDVDSIPMAWMYGLSEPGCYVYSVNSGSSAADAGIKSGDLVVAVDGKTVSTSDDIEALLDGKAVGDSVVFTLKRSGRTGEITVVLEEDVPLSNGAVSDSSDNWYDFSEYSW